MTEPRLSKEHEDMGVLDELLEWGRGVVMTPEEREAQRRSFAYGNAAIENPRVTRELVDHLADEMARKERDDEKGA